MPALVVVVVLAVCIGICCARRNRSSSKGGDKTDSKAPAGTAEAIAGGPASGSEGSHKGANSLEMNSLLGNQQPVPTVQAPAPQPQRVSVTSFSILD